MPPCFIHSHHQRQPGINASNDMLLLTPPQVKCTHLALPSCPPPPRVCRSKISYFNSMETKDDNDFNDNDIHPIMFPALPELYAGVSQSMEQPRTSDMDAYSTSYGMVLKPRPMHGSTAFARMSSPSASPICDEEESDDDEAMQKVTVGKVAKERAVHSNLLGCVQNRRSFYSRAS